METSVSVSEVNFRYVKQDNLCLENISLNILKGERFGLFGPNGSGKTTLINLMTGLLKPVAGTVQLFGMDVSSDRNAKKYFGYVPQNFAFYEELSPVENLQYFGALYGLNRNEIKIRTDELLTVLGLNDVRNRLIKAFSGGMKRRINIAIGIIHRPLILFLDEPTVGVDIQSRAAIIEYLLQLNISGTTLIYTSHYLHEAEELCDKIALIDEGKIILNGYLDKLLTGETEKSLEGLFLKLTGKQYRDL